MAKTNTTNTAPETMVNKGFELPAGFSDLGLDRFLYKPELCKDKPLVGFLIDVQEFGRDKEDEKEHWDALVVRTTQPTLVVQKDADGKEIAVEVPAGEEVMIPITDKLEKLRAFALDKEPRTLKEDGIDAPAGLMAEFFIQPIEKVVLETNRDGSVKKSMWRYKAGGKQPIPRPTAAEWGHAPVLPAAPAKANGAQLPG